MRHLRLAAIAVALFAVAGTAFAGSATHSPNLPRNLHGFMLRSNEAATHVFPRTPAFAWSPVRGALCYEFELGYIAPTAEGPTPASASAARMQRRTLSGFGAVMEPPPR